MTRNMGRARQLIYQYIMIFPCFLVIHALFNVNTLAVYYTLKYLYSSYLLLIPFTLMFLAKNLIRNKGLGILTIFAITFALFSFASGRPDSASRYALYAMALLMLPVSLFVSIKDYSPAVTAAWLIPNMIIYFFAMLFEFPIIRLFLLMNIVVTLIIGVICTYYRNMEYFLNSYRIRDIPSKTVSAMLKHSNRLLIFCVSALIVISVTAAVLPYPAINVEVDNTREEEEEKEEEAEEEAEEEEEEEEEEEKEEEETEEVVLVEERLEEIEEVGVNSFAMYVGLAAAIALILFLLKALYKPSAYLKQKDKDDFDDYFTEDEFKALGRIRKRKVKIAGTNQTVRRIYFKKVNEHKKRGIYVRKHNTAEDISRRINENEDITPLNKLYHKARYSGETVEKTELDELNTRGKKS